MRLEEIDLTKHGGYGGIYRKDLEDIHNHPDFNSEDWFLVLYDGKFYAGQFNKQWFGWTFYAGRWGQNIQYDKPGTNANLWEKVWKIIKE